MNSATLFLLHEDTGEGNSLQSVGSCGGLNIINPGSGIIWKCGLVGIDVTLLE